MSFGFERKLVIFGALSNDICILAIYLDVIHKYMLEIATASDLAEASSAIYRLQTVYDLNPADLVRGLINGKQYK